MRVCPKCETTIQNPNSHFCYNCGARLFLDDSVMSDNVSDTKPQANSLNNLTAVTNIAPKTNIDTALPKANNDKLSKRWNYFVYGANFVSIFFLLIAFGVFFRFGTNSNDESFSPLVSINKVEFDEGIILNTSSEVLKGDFAQIIPQEVIVYYESSNLSDFLNNLLSDEEKDYIEETYELSLDDLLIFLKTDFAFSRINKDSWVAVTRVGGVDFFDRTFAKYEENKSDIASIITFRINDYLIFTNSNDFKEHVESTVADTNISLGENPDFNRSVNAIEDTPFFYIYVSSKDFIDNGLKSDLDFFNLSDLYTNLEGLDFRGVAISKGVDGYNVQQIE